MVELNGLGMLQWKFVPSSAIAILSLHVVPSNFENQDDLAGVGVEFPCQSSGMIIVSLAMYM